MVVSFLRNYEYFCFPPSQRKEKKQTLCVLCGSAVRINYLNNSGPHLRRFVLNKRIDPK